MLRGECGDGAASAPDAGREAGASFLEGGLRASLRARTTIGLSIRPALERPERANNESSQSVEFVAGESATQVGSRVTRRRSRPSHGRISDAGLHAQIANVWAERRNAYSEQRGQPLGKLRSYIGG